MNPHNLWVRAAQFHIQTGEDIAGNFDIGFDERIPAEVRNELRHFVKWVEANFSLPVTLWVDFEYKHYLIRRDKERVGYLFYWSDFTSYPVFDNREEIPMIRLPVRTEYSTLEEILTSFIEAITCYFAWLGNFIEDGYYPNEEDVEEILQIYRQSHMPHGEGIL